MAKKTSKKLAKKPAKKGDLTTAQFASQSRCDPLNAGYAQDDDLSIRGADKEANHTCRRESS